MSLFGSIVTVFISFFLFSCESADTPISLVEKSENITQTAKNIDFATDSGFKVRQDIHLFEKFYKTN